jgi:hypothetical protein
LLVVVQKFVRTIRAKIRLLAVVKRPNLTASGHAYDRAARNFHSQIGLISVELALAAAASGGVAQACALAALALATLINDAAAGRRDSRPARLSHEILPSAVAAAVTAAACVVESV